MGDARIDNLKEELGEEEEVEETEEAEESDDEEESDEEADEEEGSDEEEEESGDEEEDSGDDEEEDDEEDDEDIPEKFKGKSAKEIIKSYQALEKLMGQRNLTKQERKDLKELGFDRKDVDGMEDMKKIVEGTDFTKMTPQEFATWLLEQSNKQAETRAQEIYRNASTVQQAVKTEIGEATDKYPLLKSNKEFRDLTLSVIEADAASGKMTPIIEAAGRVAKLMGAKEKSDKKKTTKKLRKRTAVEQKGSGSGAPKKTDDQKVLEGILGAGDKGGNPMGGLGI